MERKVSASIVIYKNDPLLLTCAVESFLKGTTDSRLFLIDNSPNDKFKSRFVDERITYIFNNKNLGFGPAHNIALKKSIADGIDYHIILNPDVYFDSNVISKMFAYMEQNSGVGLLMPKVLYPDGRLQPLCKLLPSPLTLFSRRFLKFN